MGPSKYFRLVAVGLLMVTVSNIFNRYIPFNDFAHGLVVGIGLGIMILGIVRMRH